MRIDETDSLTEFANPGNLRWEGPIRGKEMAVEARSFENYGVCAIEPSGLTVQYEVYRRSPGTKEKFEAFFRCSCKGAQDTCIHIESVKEALSSWEEAGLVEPAPQPYEPTDQAEKKDLKVVIDVKPIQQSSKEFLTRMQEVMVMSSSIGMSFVQAMKMTVEQSAEALAFQEILKQVNDAAAEAKEEASFPLKPMKDNDEPLQWVKREWAQQGVRPSLYVDYWQGEDAARELKKLRDREAIKKTNTGLGKILREEDDGPPPPKNVFTEFEL